MFNKFNGIILLSIVLFVFLLFGITKYVIDGIKSDRTTSAAGVATLAKKYGLWIAVDIFFVVIVGALTLLLIPT